MIGAPIPTENMAHERLPKTLALPIFASDALSSTAYASEEIMAALLLAGSALFWLTPTLSLAIIVLLTIVVASYRQIVMAYPQGGGAYIVAGDNLGPIPAQVAGASLLVDYILTVAVCDRCGRWMLSAGAVPRRCRLTLDCPGAMVKAVPAKPVTRGCLPIAPGQPQGLGGASPGQLGVVATPAATEQARGSEAKSIGESTVAQSGGLRVPIDIDR